MDPNTVVLEISSDEDIGWNDHDHDGGSGIADGGGGGDDHNWLSDLLDEVSKEEKKNYGGGGGGGGDDSDEVEVVVVSEKVSVSPTVKKKSKSKSKACSVIDLDDDCVVLEDDPDKPVEVRNGDDDSDDICVVSEKGQVACRDYPHPRHLCIKFPFSTTPNQSHCEQCYCYVCDSLAPCIYWGNGNATTDHCRATDKDKLWTLERKNAKNVSKGVQPVTNFDFHRPPPPPPLAQPHNQIPIPRPRYSLPNHPSTNFQTPNIISQNRTPVFPSRNKFHPDLVSQLLLRSNGGRPHQNHRHNLNSHVHRPVFKRNNSGIGVATTATRPPPSYGSYRGSFGNPNENRNYNVNGTLSGSNKYLGSLHLNSVNNPSVPYPQSHPMLDQPLPPEPQFSNHPSPNFQSQVNSNPFLENPLYQQPTHLVPSSSRTQPASGQPRYMAPVQSSYPVPIPVPVPPQTLVHSPTIPVSDYTQNFQGNQVQNPTLDPGLQDYGLSWLPTENPTTFEGGAAATSEPPLAEVSGGGLADYRYDWIFDNQPVEPGFMDIAAPYALNELSDSAFIDTGPIFDF